MESLQARFCIIDCHETLRVSRNDESLAVIARALPEAIYNLAKSKFTMGIFLVRFYIMDLR